MQSINPTQTSAWCYLSQHQQSLCANCLHDLFKKDKNRFERYSFCLDQRLLLDYSKHFLTQETLNLLFLLADQMQLRQAITALFHGEKINITEGQPVLHVALRNRSNTPIVVNGQDVMPQINFSLEKIRQFCSKVIDGLWRGYSGVPITDIINIGIGGSHIGPLLGMRALQHYKNHLKLHFISNVDGKDIYRLLKILNPATTLVIISSKSFSTQETMMNAATVRQWLLQSVSSEQDLRWHLVAVTANVAKAVLFGIEAQNCFEYWSWVGGRFSLWSAAGLPISLALGFKHFSQILSGAHAMDKHFSTAALSQNMPVIMALLSIWYSNFWGTQTEVILPYDSDLNYLIPYLQQISMESNGKSVDQSGQPLNYQSSPIIWGGVGTNSQHSFYQLLHQGTHLIPCDFIIAARAHHPLHVHHTQLMAHCLAQSRALAFGSKLLSIQDRLSFLEKSYEKNDIDCPESFKVLKGNIPSSTLILRELTPYNLGLLLALYENKVFAQGIILNIFSFDQWGVELGKILAEQLQDILSDNNIPVEQTYDTSTNGLIKALRSWR